MQRSIITIFILVFFMSLVVATPSKFTYNYLDYGQNIIDGFNYSINVNHSLTSDYATNSGLFDGYSSTGYRAWLEIYFDDIYCELTGCTMQGDIDMDGNDILNVDMLDTDTIEIGSTPSFSASRKIKVYDDGTQYASRVSLIGTGDAGYPAIEFVTDGNAGKRTLIRHDGEGSNDYGLHFYTTNNGVVTESAHLSGDGDFILDAGGDINASTFNGDWNGSIDYYNKTETNDTIDELTYWNRTNTTITPKTTNDTLSVVSDLNTPNIDGSITGFTSVDSTGTLTPFYGFGSQWEIRVYGYDATNDAYSSNYISSTVTDIENLDYIYFTATLSGVTTYTNFKIDILEYGYSYGMYTATTTSLIVGGASSNVVSSSSTITPTSYYTNQYSIVTDGIQVLKKVGVNGNAEVNGTSSLNILNVNGDATFNEQARFNGAVAEPLQGFSRMDIGTEQTYGNPRFVMEHYYSPTVHTEWEIDNWQGNLRFFYPFNSKVLFGGDRTDLGYNGAIIVYATNTDSAIRLYGNGLSSIKNGLEVGRSNIWNASGMEEFNVYGNQWIEQDNDKILFGDDKRAGIYTDGTNFIFNPKLVGSGIMKILGDLNVDESLDVGEDLNVGTSTVLNSEFFGIGDFTWYDQTTGQIFFDADDGKAYFNDVEVDGKLNVTEEAQIGDSENFTLIDENGITLNGSARVYKEIVISAGGIKAPGANPAAAVALGDLEIPAWEFEDQAVEALQEHVSFAIKLPDDMDRTVDPNLLVGWSSPSNGTAKWQMEYLYRKLGEDVTAPAQGNETGLSTASLTPNGFVAVPIDSFDLPDSDDLNVRVRLTRLSADPADNLTDVANLEGVVFRYVSNKIGGDFNG